MRMSEELDTARRYRLHAEELRTIAADRHSPDIRETLMRLALDYEHMAISLESIDQTNKLLRNHAGTEIRR